MPFDSDSKENSRNLERWKSWRSCYFWLFGRNKGRPMAKEHQSVKISFTCSSLLWWDIIWRVRVGHDSTELDKVSLCPVSWKASFSVSQVLGCPCSEVWGQPHLLRHLLVACEKQVSIPEHPRKYTEGAEQTDRGPGIEAEEHIGTRTRRLKAVHGCWHQQKRQQDGGQCLRPEGQVLQGPARAWRDRTVSPRW